ncbi:MAG TPA: UDP-N-acetylmuramoyl-L-alanine--D-glutamate ligase [Bacteroidales bacterium]|nr:UDP-N-acetylmuramoyl-L-alanine--D-glutamate ligase [Bacteroidales bacterium]HOX76658.1 UDP-N-acetylmuramoyl-L-alanine--D-glutamate ligase [Bacteroidales bacterium]
MNRHDIIILGGGESGAGAAVLARLKGYHPMVSDNGIIKEKHKKLLTDHGIEFEENKHSEATILDADEIIKSPGIPDKAPIIQSITAKGIPVISEIEFASRFTDARLIFITGSNGKTTTTLLTHYILTKGGLNAGLAGNVGKSFALQVATEQHDIYVLEISSFQLDGMFKAKADIAVLMNITPDHLDRYNYNFQEYIDSKFRVINNQGHGDHFIFSFDDPVILEHLSKKEVPSRHFPFTSGDKAFREGAFVRDNQVVFNINEKETSMTLEELALQGRHNLYNSMAAGISARLLEIRKETIKQCLSDFQHIEHRLEFVASIHGVDYINDSKATNVNSTWYALESMHKTVVWIAGGLDKGNDYASLIPLVTAKVRVIICLGKDNRKIIETFGDLVETVIEVQTADDAVRAAYSLAHRGEAVLLSPACASFDLFENFEDRGNQFKKAIKNL